MTKVFLSTIDILDRHKNLSPISPLRKSPSDVNSTRRKCAHYGQFVSRRCNRVDGNRAREIDWLEKN